MKLNIRRIANIECNQVAKRELVINCLKKSVVGVVYQKFFKKIAFLRVICIRASRVLIPIIISFEFWSKSSKSSKWYGLIKLADYAKKFNCQISIVFREELVCTPSPKVYPVKDQIFLKSPHSDYVFPSVYIAELPRAKVYGGTNIVFVDGVAVCHDLYDFERDYTAEELHCRHLIKVKQKRIKIISSADEVERLPVAATFVDACAPNYAHWLTEVLPRVAAFCSQDRYANIPIIVNDGLHPNIMESLSVVVGPFREVILIPIGAFIKVDLLYVTSATGYTPFEHRNIKHKGLSHGVFSPSALELVKKYVLKFLGSERLEYAKKIYLKRNSRGRQISNIDDLESIFFNYGYSTVEPEKMTFVEQVALFASAQHIVGGGGAAFANIIFSPRNILINILIGRHPHICYWYWQNIACSTGNQVHYVISQSCEAGSEMHFNFRVEPEHINEFINASYISDKSSNF